MWSIKTSSFIFQVMERTLQTMGLHPTYLEAFKATHDKILSEEAPISALDRHHLALMVSQKLLSMHPWLLNVAAYLVQRRCNTNKNGIKLQKCSCSAIIGNISKQYLILQFRSSWRIVKTTVRHFPLFTNPPSPNPLILNPWKGKSTQTSIPKWWNPPQNESTKIESTKNWIPKYLNPL